VTESLRQEFNHGFVGLPSAPWTAINPERGAAKAGTTVQLIINGSPMKWTITEAHTGEGYEELPEEKTNDKSIQALITGRLYAKPTTPIEHVDYSDSVDLEDRLGVNIELAGNTAVLVADGVDSHLLRPCNEAVFLELEQVNDVVMMGEGRSEGLQGPYLTTHATRKSAAEKAAEINRQTDSLLENDPGEGE
jgi:hypothetical protein